MSNFPRTVVGGVSLPRMLIGTNWFLGFSHTSNAKNKQIKDHQTASSIADIMEVFLEAGIDALIGLHMHKILGESIKEAQDRSGKRLIIIDTPGLAVKDGRVDWDETARVLDSSREHGATFCFPHQTTTDLLLDPLTRTIRHIDRITEMIRERGMIPGLSTHRPESVVYADEQGYDVASYIQIYNAAGFMMPLEVDWHHRIIRNAKQPVMTIKPMAAGRLLPLVGLAFAWATVRDCDMVTVGTMTPDEAREDIEISLSVLEDRQTNVELQRTRSKATVEPRA